MRFIFLCLALLFSMVLSAHSAEPLKIGVSLGLTGKYSDFSTMAFNGYKLWQADVNGRGGVLGRQVQMIVYDDKSTPELAGMLYKRLILEDKVDIVIGPYSSEITAAVVPVTETYGYPLLAPGAAADTLWQQGYKSLFGIYVPSSKYTIGFLEALVNKGFNTVAIINADDLFSKGIMDGTKEWAKRFGLNVVYTEEFKRGTRNLEQIIQKVQMSRAQALIVCGYLEESIGARRALDTVGWSPKAYYATVGPTLEKFHDVLREDAEGVFSSSQWEPTSFFPGSKEFAEKFVKTYRMTPSYHAAAAYAAGQITEAAILKAKSFDREKLRDTLYSLDTISIIGRFGVDRTGKQVRHFTSTIQWQKGRKEIIAPPELMTATPIWK